MQILVVWLALALAGAVGTIVWSLKTWRRSGDRNKSTNALIALVAASAVIGSVCTLIGLVKAFGAIGGESVDPSQKALLLGEGIAAAMNSTALGLLLWLPSVIALTVLAKRGKRKLERPAPRSEH